MEYNLETIAIIIKIIGGLAIIISLLFVGLELKESAKATRSATAVTKLAKPKSFFYKTQNGKKSK